MNEFSNKPLLLSELPPVQVASPEYQALAAKYLLVKRIRFAVNFFLLTLPYGALLYWLVFPKLGRELGLAAALLWLLLALFYWFNSEWSFRASGYALREQDLHYQTGWWWRKTRVVAYKRIQHLSINSSFIERRYGLASLAIYTAGAEQADFRLRGLEQTLALQIKELIGQKVELLSQDTKPKHPSEEDDV